MTDPAGIPSVDLSSNQPPTKTDWHAIRASGVTTAYLRAVEGVVPDTAYVAHRDAARKAGVKIGAYSFWRPRHTAYQLVESMLDVIGDDWDLPPCIDLEAQAPVDLLASKSDLEHHVATGLTELRLRTGVDPILYTGQGFVGAHLPIDHRLGQWGLWNAAYMGTMPLPRGWTKALAWQWTGTGRVPGYPGNADRSVWLCSQADLDAMMKPR